MGISVLEQIATNIEQTLATIKTPSGYQLSIQRARAVNSPRHLAGYIFQLSPTAIDDGIVGLDEWWQSFAVVVYTIPTADDATPVDSYNNDINAAIYTALMLDYSRGGLAIETKINPTLYFPPVEGEYSGITFMFDVHYRTALDKPYQAAI